MADNTVSIKFPAGWLEASGLLPITKYMEVNEKYSLYARLDKDGGITIVAEPQEVSDG